MLSKIKKIGKYVLYVLYSNVIYGLILYFTFTWLAGYSILLAYLGNLALIVLGLAWDEKTQKYMQSKKLAALLNKEKDADKNLRAVQGIIDSFISFKAALYLFYLIILIVSQTLDFYPGLLGESIGGFIHANNYSILFLIALDMLIGQFTKDRDKMAKISESLKQSLPEKQD